MMETQIDLKEFLQGTNKKGLGRYYEIGPKGLLSWMRRHKGETGKMEGGKYTPRQMLIILKKLGPPPRLNIPEDRLDELYRMVV